MSYIIITNNSELVRVLSERIVYISSDGNYSSMVLADKEERLFTFNLSTFQELIEEQLYMRANDFIRIGRGLIINRNYIYYINPSKQQLFLSGNNFTEIVELSASKEALRQLKDVVEQTIKK